MTVRLHAAGNFIQSVVAGAGWNTVLHAAGSLFGTPGATLSAMSRSIPATTTDEVSGTFTNGSATSDPSSEIRRAQWPTGVYSGTFKASAIGANSSYKIRLVRINASGTVQETLGTSGSFNDTSAHTYSTGSITPGAGADTDRIQMRILGSNSGGLGQTLTADMAPATAGVTPSIYVDVPMSAGYHEHLYPLSVSPIIVIAGVSYQVYKDAGSNLFLYSATNPTNDYSAAPSEWTLVDTLNNINITTVFVGAGAGPYYMNSMSLFNDGSTIHGVITGLYGTFTTRPRMAAWYFTFTAAGFALSELVWTASGDPGAGYPGGFTNQQSGIVVRSGGEVVVGFNDITSATEHTYYSRRTGVATWTAPTQIDGSSGGLCNMVLGASDRVHFVYLKASTGDLFHRSLNSSNTLDTEQTLLTDTDIDISYEVSRQSFVRPSGIVFAYSPVDEFKLHICTYPDTANPALTSNTQLVPTVNSGSSIPFIGIYYDSVTDIVYALSPSTATLDINTSADAYATFVTRDLSAAGDAIPELSPSFGQSVRGDGGFQLTQSMIVDEVLGAGAQSFTAYAPGFAAAPVYSGIVDTIDSALGFDGPVGFHLYIQGVEYTDVVQWDSVRITESLQARGFSLECDVRIKNDLFDVPLEGQLIQVWRVDEAIQYHLEFGGRIGSVNQIQDGEDIHERYRLGCVDFTIDLDMTVLRPRIFGGSDGGVFTSVRAGDMVKTIVGLVGRGFSSYDPVTLTPTVDDGPLLAPQWVEYDTPSSLIQKIADASQYHWYVAYDRTVHFYYINDTVAGEFVGREPAPVSELDIDHAIGVYHDMEIEREWAQVKNRLYITGAKVRSTDYDVSQFTADGNTTFFPLPFEPFDFGADSSYITLNAAAMNILREGIDGSTDHPEIGDVGDVFLCIDNHGIRFPTANKPANGDIVTANIKYAFEPVVVVEDPVSIALMAARENIDTPPYSAPSDGVHESKFDAPDLRVTSYSGVYEYGQLLLLRYSRPVMTVKFDSELQGWRPGQQFDIYGTTRHVDRTTMYVTHVEKSVRVVAPVPQWNYTVELSSTPLPG